MAPGQIQKAIEETVVWKGDPEDDCMAVWAGLILRAECMHGRIWWWAVSEMSGSREEIDSANNYLQKVRGGKRARKRAEEAARKYRISQAGDL